MTLNLDVAARQTLVRPRPTEKVRELLSGKVTIAPHAAWQLPVSPTWTEDPFGDRNWKFQYHMLRWLNPLLWAADAGDDAAWEMWLWWVRSWSEQNLEVSDVSEWAWKDMSDGIRATILCSAAPVLAQREPKHLPWLEHAIEIHARHLADPKNTGNANHALHQHEALFVVGRVLGQEKLWNTARVRMGSLIREQYDEQGMNAEGAIAYHHNNYLWWERALKRFDLEGLQRPDGAGRHERAPIGLAHATRPTGTYAPIGDTDAGTRVRALRSPFSEYVESDGRIGALPEGMTREDTLAVYDAGYVFARSGWGDRKRPFSKQTFYSVRFGPSKTVHGHPDGTSINFTSNGINWIVDPGKYDYSDSAIRHHLKSRTAHSLLTIDGRHVRRHANVKLARQIVTPELHDLTFEDNSYPRVDLRRRIVYSTVGEYLVIVDEANSTSAIRAIQNWQLGPEVRAIIPNHDLGLRAILGHRDSRATRATITAVMGVSDPLILTRAKETSSDAWVSEFWKQKSQAITVAATATGRSIQIVSVIAPGRGIPPNAQAERLDNQHGIKITVRQGNQQNTTLTLTENTATIDRDSST